MGASTQRAVNDGDGSGVQLQWYRDEQRLVARGLGPSAHRKVSDFDDSRDVLIDETLEWYTLESDARARATQHAEYAWTAYYNLDDGKTIRVEGAWDRVPNEGYPEKFGRFTLTGNGQTVTYDCTAARLRRPEVLVAVPERLLLPAKHSREGFVVMLEGDGEWRAKGYVKPRRISLIDRSGASRDLSLED